MQLIQQVLFIIMAGLAIWLFANSIKKIRRNILLGRDINISDHKAARWKRLVLLAFGQKKMFKYPVVAVFHFVIYMGFIIINIEVLEIILDGIFGTHRLFAPVLGRVYGWLISSFEVLAFGVLAACIVFLARRNLTRVNRLNRSELNGWPRKDANTILLVEIALMSLFLAMNAADRSLQLRQYGHYRETSAFIISGLIAPLFEYVNPAFVVIVERFCWWLHIAGIFAFLNYLPISKHLHILLGFPNTWYGDIEPMGKMTNMKEIQNEVLYAMQPETAPVGEQTAMQFGAKDITDLSWKNLLDAYSCTECGRCTVACPANITGKKLNPRKIMMDTRDRTEEAGRYIDDNGYPAEGGKTLLHDYITAEELRACTTCQACVEACPVSINPLDIIVQLRRHLVMEESNAPQEWNGMFNNMENNFAPWQFPPSDRDKWTQEG